MLSIVVFLHLFLAVQSLPLNGEFEKELAMGMNPEELGEFLEGDIVVYAATRNGILNESLRWQDGIVPFLIDDSHLKDGRRMIIEAMEEYHKNTCIR